MMEVLIYFLVILILILLQIELGYQVMGSSKQTVDYESVVNISSSEEDTTVETNLKILEDGYVIKENWDIDVATAFNTNVVLSCGFDMGSEDQALVGNSVSAVHQLPNEGAIGSDIVYHLGAEQVHWFIIPDAIANISQTKTVKKRRPIEAGSFVSFTHFLNALGVAVTAGGITVRATVTVLTGCYNHRPTFDVGGSGPAYGILFQQSAEATIFGAIVVPVNCRIGNIRGVIHAAGGAGEVNGRFGPDVFMGEDFASSLDEAEIVSSGDHIRLYVAQTED